MKAFIDADILIWHLRRLPAADRLVSDIVRDGHELWTGALQKVEILCLMRPDEQLATDSLFSAIATAPLDDDVIGLGASLFRAWRPSHGIGQADAMLAATAMVTGGTVYTLNVRHFPMPGLSVVRGW